MGQTQSVGGFCRISPDFKVLAVSSQGQEKDLGGAGLSNTSSHSSAASNSSLVTSSLSARYLTLIEIVTRVIGSDSDQLTNCSVTNALFGTMTSLRSQSTIVVARVLMTATTPVNWRMVTVSPIRIGFSNKIISPEMKLAKISCIPKPSPTPECGNQPLHFGPVKANKSRADDNSQKYRDIAC